MTLITVGREREVGTGGYWIFAMEDGMIHTRVENKAEQVKQTVAYL